jgi:hypothetical protein
MKNQYFGDNRDLFKYDLIQHISTCARYSKFTFIPMLTPNDDGNDGNQIERARATGGRNNRQLREYLDVCMTDNRRNITEIKSYFGGNGIETYIHREGDGYFSGNREEREHYFGEIGEEQLIDAIVFVDPDNGFQVNHSNEKHFLFSEARTLIERMSDNSLLMAIQFRPLFEHGLQYIRGRCQQIEEELNLPPMFISDNQIVFFFLTGNSSLRERIASSVEEYCALHANLFCSIPPDLFDNA